jgi:hypothetical protein
MAGMPDLKLTDEATIRAAVDKHRPLKGAVIPENIAERLGATHYHGLYHLSDEPFLLEGVAALHGMGFKTVKLWFEANPPGYAFNSKWNLPRDAKLVDIAKHEYYTRAFESPFSTFILEIQPIRKHPGAGVNDFAADAEQFEELSLHLLQTYKETNLTFILQHWEGDWMLRGKGGTVWAKDNVPKDAPQRVESFVAWLGARQKGVEAARKRAGQTQCRVLHAAEVNRVLDSLIAEVPTMTKDVLPKVALDLVSWSAYDAVHSQNAAVDTWRGVEILKHYMQPSPAGIKNHLFIGEIGIPENERTPEQIDAFWDTAMAVFLAHDLPWVVVWQLYCNEIKKGAKLNQGRIEKADDVRGFWLVKPDGSPSKSGEFMTNMLTFAGKKIQLQ